MLQGFDLYKSLKTGFIAFTLVVATAATPVRAMPAHPDLLEELKETGQLQRLADRIAAAREAGVWSNDPAQVDKDSPTGRALFADPDVPDSFRVIVLLVDFEDNPADGGAVYAQPSDFNHLLFSQDDDDNHYSMTEFYLDNSYGDFFMIGDVAGWYRMPHSYDWYVQGNNGWGAYPQNAQGLAEDAILAADGDVDYSLYDNNNDGWIDGIFIVHAGPGAEQTGSDDQIWSHKWNLVSTLNLDGTLMNTYSMEPEEYNMVGIMTMGVFAHEYGHVLGLPDLYDTDYSSSGIGDWSLMAGGSWNSSGNRPAFMDAWCKAQLGFLTPTNIAANSVGIEVPSSYHEPVAYRVWQNGQVGNEYFLIENRRATGFDPGVPGSGLLIMHIDESVGGNSNENHPLVAVEQADGLFQLEAGANSGDGNDVWSAATKDSFDDLSNPGSRKYSGAQTRAAVWDISASDSVMTANFDISYSHASYTVLSSEFSDADFGNDNGVPEEGESITFEFIVQNAWLAADNVTARMWCDNNDILFTTDEISVGDIAGDGGAGDNLGQPLVFMVPEGFTPCIDSFFLELTSDNPVDYALFGFELHLGEPEILIVDDDNGGSWEQVYTEILNDQRRPFEVHDKSLSGSPSAAYLSDFSVVIWLTGDARADVLSSADITAMQGFMDGGGGLFLTGQSIVRELDSDDQSFLNNYLKTTYESDLLWPAMEGVDGSPIGDSYDIRYYSATNQSDPQLIDTTGGSYPAFRIATGDLTGLSYEGDYRLVLFAFGLEGIADDFVDFGYATRDDVLSRVLDFLGSSVESLNPLVDGLGIEAENPLRVVGHAPTFVWTTSDTTASDIEQYQVQVGSGTTCFDSDNLWDPAIFISSDTTASYAGQALVDGGDYYCRVRVYNSQTWSDWSVLLFHMNAVSAPGLPAEPIDEALVATPTPTLSRSNPTEPEGDPLTYEFEVYVDATLTSLVAQADGITPSSPWSSWTVDVPLNEDQQYFWRSRTFDGYEPSAYTEVESFWINAVNVAPSSFDLMAPANGQEVTESYPQLVWQTAVDPDPGDQVDYKLLISTDPLFGAYDSLSGLSDTTAFSPVAIAPGGHYYWQVAAIDLLGAITWSSEVFTIDTPGSGCCELPGDANGDSAGPDIADLVFLVNYMFSGGPEPDCLEEVDINGDAGGPDIADLVALVAYMFSGGPAPAACS